MSVLVNPHITWIARPNEYERLVTDLIDQRFFGPVAISTSLRGARGMGKTTMARAVCRDPRVVEAFPDGIFWVTLGESLSPLELLSRLERLVFELSGEQWGLTELPTAEEHLRNLIHPKKVLLVLDEANDAEMVQPFLHTGPGGGVLLIAHNDDSLPFGTRRTPVDIMVSEEAVALLAVGLEGAVSKTAKEPHSGDSMAPPVHPRPDVTLPDPSPDEDSDPLLTGLDVNEPQGRGSEPKVLADPAAMAMLKQVENRQLAADIGLPAGVIDSLTELAGRLNEWPLLLTLANGLMRGCLEKGDRLGCQRLEDVAPIVLKLLDRNGLKEFWLVTDPEAREKAQDAVITACLEPLAEEYRQRLFELAVFPVFEEIPLTAVSILWAKDYDQTLAICDLLSRRALLTYDGSFGTIQLHSVLYSFITKHLRAGVLTDLHVRMIEGYAARCMQKPGAKNPADWATCPDDGYFFQHLAGHLAAAGRQQELQNLLFQFSWLSASLSCNNLLTSCRGGLYSLLIDYERALSTALDSQSAELRLVQDALCMAAPILTRDPGQLSTQLLGRLLSFDEPEIQTLLEQSRAWMDRPWLRPLSVCFEPPGKDEVRVLSGHADWVTGLALLPDGQHAISSSLDGSLRMWNLASGQTIKSILAESKGVSAMVVTQDGRQVISASWDGSVRIWDTDIMEERLRFMAHHESIGALAITPDGQRIITGADDRMIRVWDRITGTQQMELVGHGDLVRCLVVSPDGRSLISGSWDSTVRIWDLESGKQMHFLVGHEGWVTTVAISPDGGYAVSGGWDRTLRIWDLWTGESMGVLEGFISPVLAIAFLSDGKEFIAGTGDGTLHLLQFQPGAANETDPAGVNEQKQDYLLNTDTLQVIEEDQSPQLPPHKELKGHTGGINTILLTKEGRFVITASDDRTLRVWDLVAVRETELKTGHSAQVSVLENLPDGRYSLSGSWDGTLKIWDLANGAEVNTLSGHASGVVAVAISADGHRAISGSRDHTLKVWELPGGRELLTLPGHEAAVTAVSMTPDGRCAVSGAEDGSLRVWDLVGGECLADFKGEGAIWACAVAHDGRTIVASESGGKMYFLDIRR